jgi:hypothetical protein
LVTQPQTRTVWPTKDAGRSPTRRKSLLAWVAQLEAIVAPTKMPVADRIIGFSMLMQILFATEMSAMARSQS